MRPVPFEPAKVTSEQRSAESLTFGGWKRTFPGTYRFGFCGIWEPALRKENGEIGFVIPLLWPRIKKGLASRASFARALR